MTDVNFKAEPTDPLKPDLTQVGVELGPALLKRDARRHLIRAIEGEYAGQFRTIGGRSFTIGRQPDCDLILHDTRVSKRHCEVVLEQNRLKLIDLNSTNGVFLEGERVSGTADWPVGGVVQIGSQALLHEHRDLRELESNLDLLHDLERAKRYVQSLLPPPLNQERVKTDWCFEPSSVLGGDAFGYHFLDDDLLLIYLLDVSGHGVGSAMHSVTALNLLRHQTLPDVDFHQPAQVLAGLNRNLQTERHSGMFITAWCGVYQFSSRTLVYAAAGHPPAFAATADGSQLTELAARGIGVGFQPAAQYTAASVALEAEAALYIFSDGVFEIERPDGALWQLEDWRDFLERHRLNGYHSGEADRLRRLIGEHLGREKFNDDFSLLILNFP